MKSIDRYAGVLVMIALCVLFAMAYPTVVAVINRVTMPLCECNPYPGRENSCSEVLAKCNAVVAAATAGTPSWWEFWNH